MATETHMSAYERYLSGQPINEEIAALRVAQEEPRPVTSLIPRPVAEDIERELTKAERLSLKELRYSEGWPVLQRLFAKSYQVHKKSAITVSQVAPLTNSAAIAETWAYLTMYHQVTAELEASVEAEIKRLEAGRV